LQVFRASCSYIADFFEESKQACVCLFIYNAALDTYEYADRSEVLTIDDDMESRHDLKLEFTKRFRVSVAMTTDIRLMLLSEAPDFCVVEDNVCLSPSSLASIVGVVSIKFAPDIAFETKTFELGNSNNKDAQKLLKKFQVFMTLTRCS
jgi:hypothetical protein